MDPAAEAELLRRLTLAARWTVGIGSVLLIACQVLLTWGEAGAFTYSTIDYFTQEAWISFVLAVGPLVAIYGAWSGRRFSIVFEAAGAGPTIALLYALLLVEPVNLAGEPVHEAAGFWAALVVSVPTAVAGFAIPLLAELASDQPELAP